MTLCNICGRPGCRCGEVHPERLCSTHECALVCEAIPVYKIIERDDEHTLAIGPYTETIIKGWFYTLRCPRKGCGYARPLKAPTGDRKANRKTQRRKTK